MSAPDGHVLKLRGVTLTVAGVRIHVKGVVMIASVRIPEELLEPEDEE